MNSLENNESPLKIGEILLKHTKLTKEQLAEAISIKETSGKRLGNILLEKKFVLPHEIIRALCVQMDLEYEENLKPDEIDPDLIIDIPINYAKTKNMIPLQKTDNTLIIALGDPFNLEVIEDMRVLFNGIDVHIIVSSPIRIQDAINRVYEKGAGNMIKDIEEEDDENEYDFESSIDILDAKEDEAPIIRFVNSIIHRAIKEKSSDIHIETFEKEVIIRFRIDGVLHDILHQPKRVHSALTSRIKIMSNLDIAEKRLPQDGRIFRKVAGKEIDIRLSTIPTQYGERIVMRLLEKGGKLMSLQSLGFEGKSLDSIEKLIKKENGIILITGPTGSGKSTTMAACLEKINSPEINILTVEDPIEYQISGVGQVQVNPKIDLNFSRALRHFLRQDPDVIMVGEIRDEETADLATTAALTGHLVFSSMHTNEASGSFPRLIDMGIEPFLVSSSVQGVIAQRLIRRVCEKCRVTYEPSDDELKELDVDAIKGPITLYKAVGCASCNNTGYSGRVNIHEIMLVEDEIRSLIMQHADAAKIRDAAIKNGMLTIRDDGIRKILAGITTVQELTRILHLRD